MAWLEALPSVGGMGGGPVHLCVCDCGKCTHVGTVRQQEGHACGKCTHVGTVRQQEGHACGKSTSAGRACLWDVHA
eukprot:261014-Chlamydomonas_euryale.AAC.2